LEKEVQVSDTWRMLREWPELYLERLEDAGVARIVLNRPEKRNSLNAPLVEAWFASMEVIRKDAELKVVITTGNGPLFSSGLDPNFLRSVSSASRDWDGPRSRFSSRRRFATIRASPLRSAPGIVWRALGIMNCHDLVFAAQNAQFGMPEVLRGSFGSW
jgi:enoyl-CoA hydratase/carnithine racemase